jgi:DNA modification methylase
MEIRKVAIADLVLDPSNARRHDEKNLAAIKGSLKKYGQQKNIVIDKNNVIRAGNGTYVVAKDLGWTHIYAKIMDGGETDLTGYAIADNRTGELADWDIPVLGETLESLKMDGMDLGEIGFTAEDLEDLIPRPPGGGLTDDDAVPEDSKVDPVCKSGDLWVLGNHRLLCGDCTVKENVDLLMNGEKADMVFTSPPYNLGYNAALRCKNGSGLKSAYREKTDHRTQEEYLEFICKITDISIEHAELVAINIQLLAGNKRVLPEYWYRYRHNLVDLCIWDKEHAPPQMAERVLNSVFEFIFLFSSMENPSRAIFTSKKFRGNKDNIYRINPVGKKDKLASDHRAVFPVSFAEHFIDFCDKLVLDQFLGSGSTLIACEKTGRKCFGMEIDPHYCDVIIKRWEVYTGKKAKIVDNYP